MQRTRRDALLSLLALGAATPLLAQKHPRRYRVGVLLPFAEARAAIVQAVGERLAKHGFVENRNLDIDTSVASSNPDAAADLLALKPDAIFACTTATTRIAQASTRSVPIIFTWVEDPVISGIVKDYAKPGRNITGVTNRNFELVAKRLDLVRELLPSAKRVAVVGKFNDPVMVAMVDRAQVPAQKLRLELVRVEEENWIIAGNASARAHSDAILFLTPFAMLGLRMVGELAVRRVADRRIPAMYADAETVATGGLMSYATNPTEDLRRGADLLARVLKGDKPGDLPIDQASRFELVINLKTARALGLKVPSALLLRAEQVIE
jgi:putative ABC transport system substrate-binding protein